MSKRRRKIKCQALLPSGRKLLIILPGPLIKKKSKESKVVLHVTGEKNRINSYRSYHPYLMPARGGKIPDHSEVTREGEEGKSGFSLETLLKEQNHRRARGGVTYLQSTPRRSEGLHS